jgi:hypothetical protein
MIINTPANVADLAEVGCFTLEADMVRHTVLALRNWVSLARDPATEIFWSRTLDRRHRLREGR